MTAPAERGLRLMAWNPADPPALGLLGDIEADLQAQALSDISQDARDQIIQTTLAELTQMGLVAVDEDGGYWLTAAGRAALNQLPGDEEPGGPVWTVTLYRPADGLPWVIDQVTEVTETEPGTLDLVCPAGAGRGI